MIGRRDFLLLRIDPARDTIELSCERVLMKFVDARADGTTAGLFARLADELRAVQELRLVDTEWLGHEEFARQLERVLAAFRDRGGRVLTAGTSKSR
jgi:hypothetical protein